MDRPRRSHGIYHWQDDPSFNAANHSRNQTADPITGSTKGRLERTDFHADVQLAGLLSEVRLVAAAVAEFVLGADRGIAMEGAPHFFIVVDGECWLHEDGATPVRLGVGDSVANLRADTVRLSPSASIVPFQTIGDIWRGSGSPPLGLQGFDRPLHLTCGESTPACRLVGCAMIYARATGQSALIKEAPAILRLTAEENGLADMAIAIRNSFSRTRIDRYGIASTAFAQFLLIEQLKTYVDRDRATLAMTIGNGGRQGIWNLIHLLRREPARAWSIATMAREAAMSRTSFIQTFGELTGTTPFRFLAACRLDHAAELLRSSRVSTEEAVHASGYKSERAFRAAFLQQFGMTPAAFRNAAHNLFETPAPPPVCA